MLTPVFMRDEGKIGRLSAKKTFFASICSGITLSTSGITLTTSGNALTCRSNASSCRSNASACRGAPSACRGNAFVDRGYWWRVKSQATQFKILYVVKMEQGR